jgi:peptide/nickel transport system permease protein
VFETYSAARLTGEIPEATLPPPVVSSGATARRRAVVALGILAILAIAAIGAPWFAPYDPSAQPDIVMLKSLAPSWAHPFGTDPYSRDILSRAIYGARVSLSVAALATAVTVLLGTAYGAVAGYVGGWVDSCMMRLVDAMLAVPRILLLIAVVALWRSLPIWLLIVVIGATGWFGLSRMVRGQVLALRQRDFVLAAEALGARRGRIIWRHIIPNVVTTVVVSATLGIGQVIVLEAGLSYLGMGVQPPGASWGNIIQDGADQIGTLWWISMFPGLLIVITAIACNALGDALGELLDPHRTGAGR